MYRHVFHIRHKAVEAQKIPHERISRGHRTLDHGAAREAHEVDVVGVIREMVGRRTVIEMGVRDHAYLLERLEVAIDRGQGQRWAAVPGDSRGESVRCGVSESTDRIDDSLALPGQSHATGPQPFAKVRHASEPTREVLALERLCEAGERRAARDPGNPQATCQVTRSSVERIVVSPSASQPPPLTSDIAI